MPFGKPPQSEEFLWPDPSRGTSGFRTPSLPNPGAPELSAPELDTLLRPPWSLDASLDRRFENWHLPDFTPRYRPELNPGLELDDFHRGLALPKVDVFSDLAPAGLGNGFSSIRQAMDELKIEQQKQKEKYVDFPIPTSLPLSF